MYILYKDYGNFEIFKVSPHFEAIYVKARQLKNSGSFDVLRYDLETDDQCKVAYFGDSGWTLNPEDEQIATMFADKIQFHVGDVVKGGIDGGAITGPITEIELRWSRHWQSDGIYAVYRVANHEFTQDKLEVV